MPKYCVNRMMDFKDRHLLVCFENQINMCICETAIGAATRCGATGCIFLVTAVATSFKSAYKRLITGIQSLFDISIHEARK